MSSNGQTQRDKKETLFDQIVLCVRGQKQVLTEKTSVLPPSPTGWGNSTINKGYIDQPICSFVEAQLKVSPKGAARGLCFFLLPFGSLQFGDKKGRI